MAKGRIMMKRLRMAVLGLLSLLGIFILSLVLWVQFHKGEIKRLIIATIETQTNGHLLIRQNNLKINLLTNFPNVDVLVKSALLRNPPHYKGDTCIYAKTLAIHFSLGDILRSDYTLKKISLVDANVKLQTKRDGTLNISQIFASKEQAQVSTERKTVQISLQSVKMEHCAFSYSSAGFSTQSYINEAEASLDINGSVIDIHTDMQMEKASLKSGSTAYVRNKSLDIKGTIHVDSAEVSCKDLLLTLDGAPFEVQGGVQIPRGASHTIDLSVKAQKASIAHLISLLPVGMPKTVSELESKGKATFDAHIKGGISGKNTPAIDVNFSVSKGSAKVPSSDFKLEAIEIQGQLHVPAKGGWSKATLALPTCQAMLDGQKLHATLKLVNFTDPWVDMRIDGKCKALYINTFLPEEAPKFTQGTVQCEAGYKGLLSALEAKKLNAKTALTLRIVLSDAAMKIPNAEQEVKGLQASLSTDGQRVKVSNFRALVGKSDVLVNGTLPNALPWLLGKEKRLRIDASFYSKNLDFKDFTIPKVADDQEKSAEAEGGSGSTSVQSKGFVLFPPWLDFQLDAGVDNFTYDRLKISNFHSQIARYEDQFTLRQVRGAVAGGTIDASGFVLFTSTGFSATLNAALHQVQIQEVMYQCYDFGQATLTHKNVEGKLGSKIYFNANWDTKGQVIPSSVRAKVSLKIENGKVLDFKPLIALGDKLRRKDFSALQFQTLENEFNIVNQNILVPKMEIKSSAADVLLSGKHSFANEIDYQLQMNLGQVLRGKPESEVLEGAESAVVDRADTKYNLPIHITGTVDNPIVKFDTKSKIKSIKGGIIDEVKSFKDAWKVDPKKDDKKKEPEPEIIWDE